MKYRFIVCLMIFPALFSSVSFGQQINSAEYCNTCHSRLVVEWSQSRHAASSEQTNPFFKAMLTKATEAMGDKAQEYCRKCHEPVRTLNVPDMLIDAVADEGVTCDVCHATELTGSGDDTWFTLVSRNVKFGPYKDALSIGHESEFAPHIKSADFCLTCHANAVNAHGIGFCSTENEWQDSKYAEHDITCQDCHMPAIEGKITEQGKIRDEVYSHRFYGGYSEEMLSNCASLNMQQSRSDSTISIEVKVTNTTVGHALPTGSPMRMVYLSVQAKDEMGEIVWQNYTVNPLSEDTRAVFMKLLQDPDGNAPVPPWNATSVKFDQRLSANESRTLAYTFTNASATEIEAILYYRLAPPPLIKQLNLLEPYNTPIVINRTIQTIK